MTNAPRKGYSIVTCQSCNARIDVPDGSIDSEVGAKHLAECPSRDPYRFVPAWSIGWPWYHSDPVYQHGGMPKTWHPFAPKTQAEIVSKA